MRFAARPLVVIALVLGAAFACTVPVRAQETQVPCDLGGRCRTIDLRLAKRLGVFAAPALVSVCCRFPWGECLCLVGTAPHGTGLGCPYARAAPPLAA